MGIIIRATEPFGQVPPIPVAIDLECDLRASMFCRGVETFSHEDGYVGAHAAAMKAGWLERNGSEGRVWLCPRCSGKRRG